MRWLWRWVGWPPVAALWEGVEFGSRLLTHESTHAYHTIYTALDLKEFGSDGTEPQTLKQLRELAMSDSDMWDLITGSDPIAKE